MGEARGGGGDKQQQQQQQKLILEQCRLAVTPLSKGANWGCGGDGKEEEEDDEGESIPNSCEKASIH